MLAFQVGRREFDGRLRRLTPVLYVPQAVAEVGTVAGGILRVERTAIILLLNSTPRPPAASARSPCGRPATHPARTPPPAPPGRRSTRPRAAGRGAPTPPAACPRPGRA